MIVLYRETMMLQLCACYGEPGPAHARKFRKIKQFGAFWCILYFNQTSMKFTTNDSAARKQ